MMNTAHRWRSLRNSGLGLMICLWVLLSPPALAQWQAPLLDFSRSISVQSMGSEDAVLAGCVRLDGYCTLRVAAPRADLRNRIRTIERELARIRHQYVTSPAAKLTLELRQEVPPSTPRTRSSESGDVSESQGETAAKTPSLYGAVGAQTPRRLMSVTRFDADLKGVDLETAADGYLEQVQAALVRSRQERQPPYLLRQTVLCGVGGGVLLAVSWGIGRRERYLRAVKHQLKVSLQPPRSPSLQALLDERQRWNMTEAQLRLAQLMRLGLWIAGGLFAVSRFPQTRILGVRVIDSLWIPFRLLVIGLMVYLAIRISFALINRLTGVLASSYEITPELNRRLQLRVKTISQVSRGMVILAWIGVGLLAALTAVGLNIGPLLAGAGIVGLALSLPAQSLIKDAINGFFIILEDQYAVGDVITVHDIRGLVENINLRITQIRDEEGRLVTIPNSEIGVIANHSSHWSQADVYIPISYHTDVDQVLALIQQTGLEMKASDRWGEAMLMEPEVLGVEDFGERGLMIRVWIKTQPLKQWEVAREYRRRLKVALDAVGIVIPAHIDFKSPAH